MTGNGRGTMRPQGRTPPFLLIGLLVVICILGFSYWNVSSKSNDRASQITILQDEVRVLSTRKLEAEKRSEASSGKLNDLEREKSSLETRVMQIEKSLEDSKAEARTREDELQSVKNELEGKKESLNKCEQDANGIQQELQKLKEEAESLKQEAANKHECDQNACEDPIKNILTILVNSLGRQSIISTLQNNNIDTDKFIPADAGLQAGQQPGVNLANPQQPGVNLANPQQPGVNLANPQQTGVNPANPQQPGLDPNQQQPAANPADQQQPAVNSGNPQQPADQGQGIAGQVQPPQDIANPGQQNVVRKVGDGSNSTTTTAQAMVDKPSENDTSSEHGQVDREVPGSKGDDDKGPDDDKDMTTEGTKADPKMEKKNDVTSLNDKKSSDETQLTTSTLMQKPDGNTARETTSSTGNTAEAGEVDANKVGTSSFINGVHENLPLPFNNLQAMPPNSNQLLTVGQPHNPDLPQNLPNPVPLDAAQNLPGGVGNGDIHIENNDRSVGDPDRREENTDTDKESFNNPDRSVDNPDRSVDNPDRSVDNPDRSVDNPDRPMESIDRPMDSIDRPMDSIDRPMDSIDRPMDSIDRPPENRFETNDENRKESLDMDNFKKSENGDGKVDEYEYDFDNNDNHHVGKSVIEYVENNDVNGDNVDNREGDENAEDDLSRNDHFDNNKDVRNGGEVSKVDEFGLAADPINKGGENEEEEEDEEEIDNKPLKFESNNLPHLEVAKDNDAIDRMNENMAFDDRKPQQP